MTNQRNLEDGNPPEDQDAVPLEIDGVLDLHMFPPDQVKGLVRDYIDACLEAGILDLRIIHGKGIGVLRTIVYSILEKHPAVETFGHPSDSGSWGATVVRLKPGSE
ncbi:MAG: Smr/MutS family protein [Candidatus Krumholzibacteriota bacterium]